MRLTPLEVRQQRFRRNVWGVDRHEVEAFLDVLANDIEHIVRENHTLRDELEHKDAELRDHRERERTLKDTMITATRITEDIKRNARKEAEIVIAQAEAQAEQIIQNAHARLVRMMEDIDELRRQRAQFEASLRSTLAAHSKLMDTMHEREGPLEPPISIVPRGTSAASESGAPKVVSLAETQPPPTP